MRRLYPATALLLAVAGAAAPAMAQKVRAEDCPGSMHGDTCEMTSDQYDTYTRNRDWNENVRRNEAYAAQSAQLRANARAEANEGRISRSQAIMRRRHAAAAEIN